MKTPECGAEGAAAGDYAGGAAGAPAAASASDLLPMGAAGAGILLSFSLSMLIVAV
jgi:hypothetical protein